LPFISSIKLPSHALTDESKTFFFIAIVSECSLCSDGCFKKNPKIKFASKKCFICNHDMKTLPEKNFKLMGEAQGTEKSLGLCILLFLFKPNCQEQTPESTKFTTF
jgi:hypothetical protein